MMTIALMLQSACIAAIDARVLLRATLGVNDAYLVAHADDEISVPHAAQFRAFAAYIFE